MNVNMLRAQLVLQGKNVADLSKVLNISKSTGYRKINGSSDFSREQIQKIIDFLNLSNDDAMAIFFEKKVS